MALKEIVEGKPLRIPLHPALVHFPIALLTLGVLLDLAGWFFPRPDLVLGRSGAISLAAGVITALIAALAGAVDYTDIRKDHPAKKTATLHMVLNLAAVALFCVSLGLRFGHFDDARTPGAPLILEVIGLLVLGYSGYLGGSLVYGDGIGVGRHRRQTPTPQATREISAPEAGREVMVGRADQLADGETARLEVDGTVVVLVREGGEFFALQEFCTHRSGPLSEGRVQSGRIECPWHRSQFDLRTGAVCQGPARVELRTFPLEVRKGEVWIRVPPRRAPESAGA